MDPRKALNTIISRSGMAPTAIARKMGKSDTYVSTIKTRGTVPSVGKFAAIADACGYDTLARSRETGEEIVIDPPGK